MPGSDSGDPTAASKLEWQTLALATVIYGGWLAVTFLHDRFSVWLVAGIGGMLTAWHNSLQHETIHGHPTPWRWLNTAIGFPPLSLLSPYRVYRDSHLAHHASHDLTHPGADPESRYLDAAREPGWLTELAAKLQSTLLGRLVLGPVFESVGFAASQVRALRENEPEARAVWLTHLVSVGLIIAWLHAVCHLSFLKYLACFVYPGMALSLIRSFAEHRAHPALNQRVAIVERAPLFGILFLNNNLHAAHHARPGLAWWRLPAFYRSHRDALLSANGGLVYRGYGEVFARYLFRPHDQLRHPGYPAVATGLEGVR